MQKNRKNIKSTFRLGFALISIFLAGLILTAVYSQAKSQALREAEEKALLVLNRNLSIHTYFTQILKPSLFNLESLGDDSDYFDPVWMSSSYAVRKIEGYTRQIQQENYFYKESVINARSPANEADSLEKAFIEELNRDPELVFRSGVRNVDGEPVFYVLRRGEVHQRSCTQCHTDPAIAPTGLVKTYGSVRGFYRNDKEGDVISAISIRIPIEDAYRSARMFTFQAGLALTAFFILLYFVQYHFFSTNLFIPIQAIRDRMTRISVGEDYTGEQIPDPDYDELADLASAFNRMSTSLLEEKNHLEEKVELRTSRLNDTAARLQEALAEKDVLFKEVHHRIKNNLQLISNILSLKEMEVGGDAAQVLADCQRRIHSVSSIHEILYRTEEGKQVNFTKYIDGLIINFRESYGKERSHIELKARIQEDVLVELELAVTLGLIINELLTNSFKYAFKDRPSGMIEVTMKMVMDSLQLTIEDNGVGLPADVDLSGTGTVGLSLVKNLSEQAGARLEIDQEDGTRFSLTLPLPEEGESGD